MFKMDVVIAVGYFSQRSCPFFHKGCKHPPFFLFFYWILKVITKRNFVPHKKASKILQGANIFFLQIRNPLTIKMIWYPECCVVSVNVAYVVNWFNKECKACRFVIETSWWKRWSGNKPEEWWNANHCCYDEYLKFIFY